MLCLFARIARQQKKLLVCGGNTVDSVSHNLLHALQWEQHDYAVADKQQRWNLNKQEADAVEKWINARIDELLQLRGD